MDKFTLGRCSICGKDGALKNDVCSKCKDKIELPDFFKDIFKQEDK